MNLRLVLDLSCLLLVFNVASCAYQPWEDIKTWYKDLEYDQEEADARHAIMEQNCTDAIGESEGLCFDECMFRTQYQFIVLYPAMVEPTGKLYTYSRYAERGIVNLEWDVLRIKGVEKMHVGNYTRPMNEEFYYHMYDIPCQQGIYLIGDLHLQPETQEKLENNYLEAAKNLCTQPLNEEEKYYMTFILNCTMHGLPKKF